MAPHRNPSILTDAAPGAPRSRATWITLTVIVWVGLINFPLLPALELDPSWKLALNYAAGTDLQFGTDLVFTYGPLGYLSAAMGTGSHFPAHLLWQLGLNLPIALSLVYAGIALRGLRLLMYLWFLLGLAVGFSDVFQIILILIWSVLLLRGKPNPRPAFVGALACLIGIMALVKFTNLLYAGVALTCVAAAHVSTGRWRTAAWAVGSFAITFLGGWLLCGQNPANLPAFMANSLDISRGYVDAMGLQETPELFRYGVATGILLVAYLSLHLWRNFTQPVAWAAWAIAGAGGFLNWKHGFVRADGHVLAHFFYCLLFCALHGELFPAGARLRTTRAVLATAIAVVSVMAIARVSSPTVAYSAAEINQRYVRNLSDLAHLGDVSDTMSTRYEAMQKAMSLRSLQVLGEDGRRIDFLGHDIGFAIVNRINYRPRPTLQSYAAMTPRLAELNRAFYADPARAPALVMSREQTIDDRLPTLDDAPTRRYLYHHYDYALEEKGFVFWTRRPDPEPHLDQRVLITEQTVRFGEVISTPMRDDAVIYCEVQIDRSVLGRLRAFLYKPPPVYAATDDGGFDQRRFLLPPTMAAAGFLTYPYISNEENIINYWNGQLAPRLMRFAIELDPGMEKYYRPVIRVRFYAYPPIPRPDTPRPPPPELQFRALSREPQRIESDIGTMPVIGDFPDRYLVHAPSALHFDNDGTVTQLTGSFGIFEGAYSGEGQTDGVRFTVEWIGPTGEQTVLWERLLEPLAHTADQGSQALAVALPAESGELILRTDPGPAGNPAFDWAYWSELQFKP